MLVLIVAILFGLGVAYFALQNTTVVTVSLLNNTLSGVPLYVVMIASLLTGIVIAWTLHLLDSAATGISSWRRERRLHHADSSVTKLQEKVQALEGENRRLKEQAHHSPVREQTIAREHKPSLWDRFREPRLGV